MKKKNVIWAAVISALVLVIAVVIIGVCNWFFSPGVHVLGPAAHVDAKEKCYYIDYKTGEIMGESKFLVKFDVNVWTGTFTGTMMLRDRPLEGLVPANPEVRMHEGYISIHYAPGFLWELAETNEAGEYVSVPPMDSGYQLYVKDEDHLFIVTTIDEKTVLVVCADDARQAKELARTLFYLHFGRAPQNW